MVMLEVNEKRVTAKEPTEWLEALKFESRWTNIWCLVDFSAMVPRKNYEFWVTREDA